MKRCQARWAFYTVMAIVVVRPVPAFAVNSDPNDYVALPTGTNLLLQYYEYADDDNLNLDGKGEVTGHLNSAIGILRYVHYTTLFGITVDPQFLLPFGGIYNVNAAGTNAPGNSGVSDPILAMTIWPINRPDTSTYLGITPLIYVPIGSYNSHDSVNLGNNRWQGDLQIGFQTAFGRTGLAKNIVFALYGDGNFYGDNDRYLGNQRLRQGTSWQLQPWLTYNIDKSANVSFGFSSTMGGRESLNGIYTGEKTEEDQVRFEAQKFVTDRVQLVGEVTRDVHVSGGYNQAIGVNLRLMVVF